MKESDIKIGMRLIINNTKCGCSDSKCIKCFHFRKGIRVVGIDRERNGKKLLEELQYLIMYIIVFLILKI